MVGTSWEESGGREQGGMLSRVQMASINMSSFYNFLENHKGSRGRKRTAHFFVSTVQGSSRWRGKPTPAAVGGGGGRHEPCSQAADKLQGQRMAWSLWSSAARSQPRPPARAHLHSKTTWPVPAPSTLALFIFLFKAGINVCLL